MSLLRLFYDYPVTTIIFMLICGGFVTDWIYQARRKK